jgi:hypothetical protein
VLVEIRLVLRAAIKPSSLSAEKGPCQNRVKYVWRPNPPVQGYFAHFAESWTHFAVKKLILQQIRQNLEPQSSQSKNAKTAKTAELRNCASVTPFEN